jgi:hypothetical protein
MTAAAPDPGAVRRYVQAGLQPLGLVPSDAELAVIEAVEVLYRPVIAALLDAELDGVEPEPGADMSREPQRLEHK